MAQVDFGSRTLGISVERIFEVQDEHPRRDAFQLEESGFYLTCEGGISLGALAGQVLALLRGQLSFEP